MNPTQRTRFSTSRAVLAGSLLLAAAWAPGARAQVLLSEDFEATDGGFTATFTGPATGQWIWSAGQWTVDGDGSLNTPTSNLLTSPAVTVASAGVIRFTVEHRYSFEEEWDGAVIQYSLDGGAFQTIPNASFSQNGYNFASLIGNHVLTNQPAFNGNSPDYDLNAYIISIADLPPVAAGATVSLRLLGAWDEGAQGSLPNWDIASVKIERLEDTDGDGMPDSYEDANGLNKNSAADKTTDLDSDGLNNYAEFLAGTDPQIGDTDGDGLTDGKETNTGTWVGPNDTGTNPLAADTDGDGLRDGVETNTGTFVSASNTGTNPHAADTDSDGIRDGLEIRYASNPNNAASTPFQPGVPTLLAYWPFNDSSDPAAATDVIAGFEGIFAVSANYTADGEGHTAGGTDKAVRIEADSSAVVVAGADFLNLAAARDKITISFWQKRDGTGNNSSSFWGISPGSSGTQRGIQAHVPWSDGNFYFDSAGCCGGTQRSSGAAPGGLDWTEWSHFVFIKDGASKSIWVNGALALSGTGQGPLPTDFTEFYMGASGEGTPQSIGGSIDDFAIFGAALSESEIMRLYSGETPIQISTSSDADNDGLPDQWETQYFPSDLTKLTATGDFDSDGLTDTAELLKGTNPTLADTDGDGLGDKAESGTGTWVSLTDTGTSPTNPDTDGDGLGDGVENPDLPYVDANQTGSDPNKVDTDGDGFQDGQEVALNSNPNDANSTPPYRFTVLGIGTAALIGGDLTDPENDIDDSFAEGQNFNWISSDASSENYFGSEGGLDIFDNKVGGGEMKWCCDPAPQYMTLGFASPVSLTHFTIASGNDTPGRDPVDWQILGSNDGVTFTPVFTWLDPGTKSIWTERNQVIRVDLPGPTEPYLFLQYSVTRTAGAPNHQIGEIEYFGTSEVPELRITDVSRAPDDVITLTWTSTPGKTYTVYYSTNTASFTADVVDGLPSGGSTTTHTFANPLPGAPRVFFRVAEMP